MGYNYDSSSALLNIIPTWVPEELPSHPDRYAGYKKFSAWVSKCAQSQGSKGQKPAPPIILIEGYNFNAGKGLQNKIKCAVFLLEMLEKLVYVALACPFQFWRIKRDLVLKLVALLKC